MAANGVHPAEATKEQRNKLKAQAALITPFDGNGKTSSAAQLANYSVVVQDHDDDNKSESDIRQIYAALEVPYLAFTTSSHTDDAPRWKVLIPLAVPCNAEQHGKISRGLALSLGTDTAQARTQQGFYAPHKLIDDAPYSVIDELDSYPPVDIEDKAHPFTVEAMAGWAELEEAEEEGAAAQAQVKSYSQPMHRARESLAKLPNTIATICEPYYSSMDTWATAGRCCAPTAVLERQLCACLTKARRRSDATHTTAQMIR